MEEKQTPLLLQSNGEERKLLKTFNFWTLKKSKEQIILDYKT